MIRAATSADIPFLLDVARARYTEAFDAAAVRAFLAGAIANPSLCVLRSERGGAVAAITKAFWGGPSKAYLLFIVALPGRGLASDGLALVRAVDAWRRERGAESLHFGEDTGMDFAPLARRLGATTDRPSYVIRGGQVATVAEAPASTGRGSSLLDRVLTSPNLLSGRAPLKLVESA